MDDEHISRADLATQFRKLIVEPLRFSARGSMTKRVIIIDALDECGTSEEQRVIARCLASLACSTSWTRVASPTKWCWRQ